MTRVRSWPGRARWATVLVAAAAAAAVTVATVSDESTRASSGTPEPNEVSGDGGSDELLRALASLTVAAEPPRTGYARELFPHWDDEDDDGCNTRCEVLAAQRRSDGFWLSAWDGYRTDDPTELQVDHVVALAEAWDSGAAEWPASRRDEFADDPSNLLAVTASANVRKGDKDAAEWFPSRAEANCVWASTVVRVKQRWDLRVDRAEADALGNLLRTCADHDGS